MVKPTQLGHINIRVKDLARSDESYNNVLRLEVTRRRETILFLSTNDLSHELSVPWETARSAPTTTVLGPTSTPG
mgnify:CR=1 FL=1